jgi:hypothetical protein
MTSVSPWSPAVTSLLAVALGFNLAAFGLFHLMIHKVNAQLSDTEKIPHSLYWGRWNQLRALSRNYYPRSSLYSVVVTLAVIGLVFAACAAGLLWWQFAVGK